MSYSEEYPGQSDLIAAASLRLARVTAFVAVARRLSFTSAAEDLHVVQPWLSTQVRSLERDLGLTLFDRSNNRRLDLAPAGRELLPAAEQLIADAAVLVRGAERIGRCSSGRLALGTPPYATSFPARRRLVSAFVANHPGIVVDTRYGASEELLMLLRRGELDLAFILDPEPGEELRSVPVQRLWLFIAVPYGHPLAAPGPIRPVDLGGYEVVSFDRSKNPALFDRRFGPLSAAGARIVAAPESMPDAVGAFALDRGLLSLVSVPEPTPAQDGPVLLRPLKGTVEHSELRLVAPIAGLDGAALGFWSQAEQVAAEQ